MANNISLEPDEKIIFEDSFQANRSAIPFSFKVTDRAVLVSKEKHFARESWYFERIAIYDVKHISLFRESRFWLWTISILVFLVGLAMCIMMILNAVRQLPEAYIYAFPFVITIVAPAMPFMAKGRKILVVESSKGKYKWKPKVLFATKEDKNRVQELQENILKACQKVGIKTFKEV